MVRLYPLFRGIASYGIPRSLFTRPGTGGSFSAPYCYSVWFRHLVHLYHNGLVSHADQLQRVAEIGPGDSLGSGMAGLYSGAKQYTALDIIRHAGTEGNLRVNDQLLGMFLQKADIPHREFPDLHPSLPGYLFPEAILPADDQCYHTTHNLIKQAAESGFRENTVIRYLVPWMEASKLPVEELDLVFSQAAMEHVENIAYAYRLMYSMLRPGGIISHQVDFRSHQMTTTWDGHFYIGSPTWRILAHGHKYPMNRLPLSAHLRAITSAGFRIVAVKKQTASCSFPGRLPLVPDIMFDNDDLVTTGALILARK